MKAIVYTEYGPPEVLRLEEKAKPGPKDNEVLIKNRAATVNYGDLIARDFKNLPSSRFYMPGPLLLFSKISFGLSKPKMNILGNEFAGEIEAVGKDITQFKKGDRVFGYRGPKMGTYAEYLCMPEKGAMARIPDKMTFEQAAAVPYGFIVALNVLKKGNIRPGQKVLVNGASGSIGSAAVQIAKYFGAEVTGVCGPPRLEYVQALGADKVIDYHKQDFTTGSEKYDLIFDVLGKSSFSRCKKVLTPNGICLYASFKVGKLLQMLWTSMAGKQKAVCALTTEKPDDLPFAKHLIETGKYQTIIDKRYPLEQAAAAHRYMETGLAQGKVVISITH